MLIQIQNVNVEIHVLSYQKANLQREYFLSTCIAPLYKVKIEIRPKVSYSVSYLQHRGKVGQVFFFSWQEEQKYPSES